MAALFPIMQFTPPYRHEEAMNSFPCAVLQYVLIISILEAFLSPPKEMAANSTALQRDIHRT
jgi:hypothetical protein